jgi:HSP20 family protein
MVRKKLLPENEQLGWTSSSDSDSRIDHFHWRVPSRQHAWRPPTDVYLTEEAVIVRVEVAGMRNGDFSITFEDKILTIQGSRLDRAERRAYHQMEIRFGEFRTDVKLHWPVETEEIDAEYKDGILRVILPLAKTQNIEIQE